VHSALAINTLLLGAWLSLDTWLLLGAWLSLDAWLLLGAWLSLEVLLIAVRFEIHNIYLI
jgi:hypothetical protein